MVKLDPIINDLMVIGDQRVSADKYKVGTKRHHCDIIDDDGRVIYQEWHSGKRPECEIIGCTTNGKAW